MAPQQRNSDTNGNKKELKFFGEPGITMVINKFSFLTRIYGLRLLFKNKITQQSLVLCLNI
jgi:uncharacterized membrane protein (UPF0182 family)